VRRKNPRRVGGGGKRSEEKNTKIIPFQCRAQGPPKGIEGGGPFYGKGHFLKKKKGTQRIPKMGCQRSRGAPRKTLLRSKEPKEANRGARKAVERIPKKKGQYPSLKKRGPQGPKEGGEQTSPPKRPIGEGGGKRGFENRNLNVGPGGGDSEFGKEAKCGQVGPGLEQKLKKGGEGVHHRS